MRHISKDERTKIQRALIDNSGDYRAVAVHLHVTVHEVYWVDIVENRKFNHTELGRGRPELHKFVIAIRSLFTTTAWNNNDAKIHAARQAYDRGEVEITTGRDGENLILYAIPRKKKAQRTKSYFILD